jgi:hypothetical protein
MIRGWAFDFIYTSSLLPSASCLLRNYPKTVDIGFYAANFCKNVEQLS